MFILDRSGLEADTIGGFNSLIKKQREESGEAIVSIVLFDDNCDVIHDRVSMERGGKADGEYLLCPWLHGTA